MSEQILQQILVEMKGVKSEIAGMKSEMASMKAQLDENTQIVKVIRDRQEETDAKLENLAMDVHQMRGELTALTGTVHSLKDEIEFITLKTNHNEMEIFKLHKSILKGNVVNK